MQPGAHLLLGQAALREKLLHQPVVGLGDVFNELACATVSTFSANSPVARGFGELAALVGRIGDDLVARHVQHLVEAGAGINRHG